MKVCAQDSVYYHFRLRPSLFVTAVSSRNHKDGFFWAHTFCCSRVFLRACGSAQSERDFRMKVCIHYPTLYKCGISEPVNKRVTFASYWNQTFPQKHPWIIKSWSTGAGDLRHCWVSWWETLQAFRDSERTGRYYSTSSNTPLLNRLGNNISCTTLECA